MSNIIDEIKLKIIFICHLAIVLFVIITPFTNSNYLLIMHSIIVPFIIMHWISNNNICALTLFEKEIRRKLNRNPSTDDCFTCKIIEPIYDFKNNNKQRANFIYTVAITLWGITIYKLFNKYKNKEINKFSDLFII